MMAKIVKGSDFKGVVDYIIDKKKDTQIVASEGDKTCRTYRVEFFQRG